ncbi:MAG: DUF6428 family protein [Hymenobacter sp.]
MTKHFIDCGGGERRETVANFQLWEASDYDHRLAPQKFLDIINLSEKVLGSEDPAIEVEYQQATIGKFGLAFDGTDFVLTPIGLPHQTTLRCRVSQSRFCSGTCVPKGP